jgi:pyruvate/2-oxoglutarate dehydrogenase complex dihydrolipoamide dehydrogenase (E3) component
VEHAKPLRRTRLPYYRIIRDNLLRGGQATTRGRLVPYTVFIDPQLGRVGLTEQEARAQGRPIHVAKPGNSRETGSNLKGRRKKGAGAEVAAGSLRS